MDDFKKLDGKSQKVKAFRLGKLQSEIASKKANDSFTENPRETVTCETQPEETVENIVKEKTPPQEEKSEIGNTVETKPSFEEPIDTKKENILNAIVNFLPPKKRKDAKNYIKKLDSHKELFIKNNIVYHKKKRKGHLVALLANNFLSKHNDPFDELFGKKEHSIMPNFSSSYML